MARKTNKKLYRRAWQGTEGSDIADKETVGISNDLLWLYEGQIILNDDINENSAHRIIQQLDTLFLFDKNNGLDRDIRLLINSTGGNVVDSLAMYDYMRYIQKLKKNIVTMACGVVASAAVIVLLGAKYRVSFPNATFMIHGISGSFEGGKEDLKIYSKEMKREQKVYWDIITKNTKIKKKNIDTYTTDTYLNAKEAKKLGLITKVI